MADQQTNEVYELYSVPLSGGTPVRLNRPPVAGGDVLSFAASEDGLWVVYLADLEEDGRNELYRVRTDGSSEPEKLNGPLVPGGDVGRPPVPFRISADGQTVLYLADELVDERIELFSAVRRPGRVLPR